MSAPFNGYYDDFENAHGDAMKAIDSFSYTKDPQKKQEYLTEAKGNIEEVERYIRILEQEAKKGGAAEKRKMQDQVRHCKTELTILKSSLEKAQLIGDARAQPTATNGATLDPKEMMSRYEQRLERTGGHLADAQRTLAETEAIATNVTNNLAEQRNHLEHAQADVNQMQDDTIEAGSHLKRLYCKAVTSKICLIFIIICLVIGIAIAAYWKFYPRDKKDYLGIIPTPSPAPTSSTRLLQQILRSHSKESQKNNI